MGRGRPVAYWQGCLPFGLEWARCCQVVSEVVI